MKKSNFVKL